MRFLNIYLHMKRKIRLTESELTELIRRIVQESSTDPEVEEGWLGDKLRDAGRGIKKITTGKETPPEEYFIDDILKIQDEMEENPEEFVDYDNWDRIRQKIMDMASDNNYSGKLSKKMTKSGKYKVVYEV
jgi:hypothetical protein